MYPKPGALLLCSFAITTTKVIIVQTSSDTCSFVLEEFHSLCKHCVGRQQRLWIFFHGNAALNKEHGSIKVVESFTELIRLRREKHVHIGH